MKLKQALNEIIKDGISYETYLKYKGFIEAFYEYKQEYLFIETIGNNGALVTLTNDITKDMEDLVESGHGQLSYFTDTY